MQRLEAEIVVERGGVMLSCIVHAQHTWRFPLTPREAWLARARHGLALCILLLAAPLGARSTEVSIPSATSGGIRQWHADGSRGLWIEATTGHWYYAGFSSRCAALPAALDVRFIPGPNGALSRWSSIVLAHDQRCFFRTLQPSNAPPRNVAQ